MNESKTEIAVKTPIAMGNKGLQLRSFDELWRFASAVNRSGLAPQHFNTPEKICIAVQHGAEVGLSPIQSLHSIAVINGRPSLYGDALPALAWGSGVLKELHEEIEGKGDDRVAVCMTRRVGQEMPCITRFSVADAKQAKLWGKTGPWTQYPQRMLQMRARSWNFRDNLADVLKGMHITEEVADYSATPTVERVEQKPALSLDGFKEADEIIDAEVEPAVDATVGGDEPQDSAEQWLERADLTDRKDCAYMLGQLEKADIPDDAKAEVRAKLEQRQAAK